MTNRKLQWIALYCCKFKLYRNFACNVADLGGNNSKKDEDKTTLSVTEL